ncbi:glycoside hydrolase family 2 TIM barrel-domain containing protein [Arachidicoccus soli]|uniref:beta-galactosidase n=1 Tax=Arachidicoccus soli TaxID=2341117 RepID=A0A386HQ98_9BACT|nr:glycoside hydrolase family 2 TIM barrel-domain containing protein [Arachidicoccus soli]AYD47660.1 glycoside hydrolase family 2 [Arachidicoccus soli]
MKAFLKIKIICIYLLWVTFANAQQTQKIFLSGTGSDHTVNWHFYCTAGQNSRKWTTIPVPSNWELQGFGTYNYGLDKDSLRTNEEGFYKYHFQVPKDWKGKTVRIVFDGSMTDTKVKINGKSAGAIHQGSFYRFKYDISKLLKYGQSNLLEVTVAKNSANKSVNAAERKGDFWIFGGIYRPVYLEALPAHHMEDIAVNALANGSFSALIHLNEKVKNAKVSAQLYKNNGTPFEGAIENVQQISDSVVELNAEFQNPKLWSPEFPNLYKVVFTLKENGKTVHQVAKTFGFRTVEVRQRDGIYINGVKIKFKGVGHHSFWPTTGRAMSKAQCIADVELIKGMNMNAVRMTHYPPDTYFLDACDSLGLFVLDELTGWHHAYDTQVGSKLVKEMIEKDQNHPSIVMWDNGNEGGFNFSLDHLFNELDFQHRPLIHPWAIFGGMDTQHYINYDYGNGTSLQGHNIVFPTEFLHGLYDGGAGAGLQDYWNEMLLKPLSAGGFIWVFADEDVVRTDKKGKLDSDGDHAPDGILGPYHEKEGSYNAIKEIWSPVYIEHREITPAFDGTFRLQNRYFFTNINQCSFKWSLVKLKSPFTENQNKDARMDVSGTAVAPNIAVGEFGTLQLMLPKNFEQYDVLYLTATDPHGKEIYTWSFPISRPSKITKELIKQFKNNNAAIDLKETDSGFMVTAKNMKYAFNKTTGFLKDVWKGGKEIPFNNGPVLCGGDAVLTDFKAQNFGDSIVLTASFAKESDMSKLSWTVYSNGLIKMNTSYFPHQYDFDYLGVSFSFPENLVQGIEWMGNGPYRVWKNRMQGVTLNVWDKKYNNTITGQPQPAIIYPEFKGYFSDFYWMKLKTAVGPIDVFCADEDIFLRLFTPAKPAKAYNTAPAFPQGDISFMHAIDPIGTKSQIAENMGPSGRKNMYYDYGKSKDYAKDLTLYFDFSGNNL